MRKFILVLLTWTLVSARPETYRENEDFKYARSSTDEGSKSGFYGAQRGNMGGNYERAHNMDGLAQHQMSSLVRQVDGELGDTSKSRAGSVYTSSNSRGIYGTGNFDLSNLSGRNFKEGLSLDESQSHYAGYNAEHDSIHNSAYSSSHVDSRHNNAYQQAHYGSSSQNTNLEANSNFGGYGYDRAAANSGYNSHSGYESQSSYSHAGSEASRRLGANTQTVLIGTATPARVVIRPGTKITIPVAAQTYDASQASTYNRNSEAELLANSNVHTNIQPSNNNKHYESAYSYRKEWEKHDTKPVAVPLGIPTVHPLHSELYDDLQVAQGGQYETNRLDQSSQSNNAYTSYNANMNSAAASQSRHQSQYNNQQYGATNSHLSTNAALNTGTAGNAHFNTELDGRPKSYQSSYSYHKSWERQGDPYVIVPTSNGVYEDQTSQRLTSGSSNSYSQHRAGCVVACDPNGHLRVARSTYNSRSPQREYQEAEYFPSQQQTLTPQEGMWDKVIPEQSQNKWRETENLSQIQAFGESEHLNQETQHVISSVNFGQQSQTNERLEDFGQQSQSADSLVDFGQQSQTNERLEDFGQQSQSADSLVDFGQQSQTNERLEDFGQQPQSADSLVDFGQQSQTNERLENFGQQSQSVDSLVDFGQQSQTNERLQDFGQQSQSADSLVDFGKQSQTNERLKDFGQQSQNADSLVDFGQQSQTNERLEDLGQQAHTSDSLVDFEQQSQTNERLENFGQQSQSSDDLVDFRHQKQTNNNTSLFSQQQSSSDSLVDFGQQTQNTESLVNFGQKIQNNDKLDHNFEQQVQNTGSLITFGQQSQNKVNLEDYGQQTQNHNVFEHAGQKTLNSSNIIDFEQQVHNIDAFGKQTLKDDNFMTNFGHQTQQEDSGLNFGPQAHQHDVTNFGQEAQNSWQSIHHISTGGPSESETTINNFKLQNNEHIKPVWEMTQDVQNITTNKNSQGLSSLWGKLDNLEKQTLNDNGNTMSESGFMHSHSYSTHSYHSQQASEQQSFGSHSSNAQSSYQSQGYYPNHNTYTDFHHTTFGQNNNMQNTESVQHINKASSEGRGDVEEEEIETDDIGRGDIGNDADSPAKITEPCNTFSINITLPPVTQRTPQKNESLNLGETHQNNQNSHNSQNFLQNSNEEISVIGLTQVRRDANKKIESTTSRRVGDVVSKQYPNPEIIEVPEEAQQADAQQNVDLSQINENLYQQGQTSFGNTKDFGQQVQTVWDPTENLQQQANDGGQQIEDLGSINAFHNQQNDFYKQEQTFRGKYSQERIKKVQEAEKAPLEVQRLPEMAEPTTTTAAPVTENKGFWNSLGDKFTSAKTKVSSWFSGS